MSLKTVSVLLVLLLGFSGASMAFASGGGEKNLGKVEKKIEKRAAKIKRGVEKLGVGKDSIVKVKLRDKSTVTGYVSEISDGSFTLIDKTGNETVVEYTNAKQIKGNNLSTGAWIAIGVGIGAVVFGILLWAVVTSG